MRYIGVISILVLLLSLSLISGCIMRNYECSNTKPVILEVFPENEYLIKEDVIELYAYVIDKDKDLMHIGMSWKESSSVEVKRVLDIYGCTGKYLSQPINLSAYFPADSCKHEIIWYLIVTDGKSYTSQSYKFYYINT